MRANSYFRNPYVLPVLRWRGLMDPAGDIVLER
jgi:hypothetical protein